MLARCVSRWHDRFTTPTPVFCGRVKPHAGEINLPDAIRHALKMRGNSDCNAFFLHRLFSLRAWLLKPSCCQLRALVLQSPLSLRIHHAYEIQ